jgi:hypothetical protein
MTMPLTLFDLFGEANADSVAAVWPTRVQPFTGLIGQWPPPQPAFSQWLAALNNTFSLSAVRTGAANDRVAVEAKLTSTGLAEYAAGFPFVISSMPDVEFRIQYATPIENQIHLFASLSDRGTELVLERLPVQILLPAGLITPHPDEPDTIEIGDFRPGHLDDLKIRFDGDSPVSIFVHVRVHMTEDGDFDIRPAVPVSFGKCTFTGIPCLAVHDFQLIPSPGIAPQNVHWLRHQITPWTPDAVGPLEGCFSVRSVYIDPDTSPISDAAHWLNSHESPEDNSVTVTGPPQVTGESDAHAELVLDDLVVPFYSPWVLPIPRHVTVGLRRRVLDKNDPKQVFNFDNAPVRTNFSSSPAIGMMVEDFFFKSSPDELGLTFDASVVFGQTSDEAGHSDAMAVGITLEEHYTFSLTYKRDFSSTTGMPQPGTGAAATINALLHWEIATVVIDIMTIKLGFSFGRFIVEKASFGDSALATLDVFVSMPPTGSGFIKLRSLNGENVKFIVEGIGWRFGSLHFEGVAMPDGVVLIIADKFGLVLQELGLRSEDSATYFSISGGLMIELPSGFSGGFFVRRLRFRTSGNPSAPPFKLDGFYIQIKTTVFQIDAGGYYTETTTGTPPNDVTVKEFGLTGTVAFSMGGVDYLFGLDFIVGHVKSSIDNFDYLLIQAFYHASVECAYIELSGARVLFARNMKPKLAPVDKDSRELRYYTWYKNSDPLTVPGERRLAAWQPIGDSIAVGIGASVSLAGCGSVFELGAFILFVYSPDEKALLIVVEVRLLNSPKPIGYLAIELDFQHGLYHGVLGVQLELSNFVDDTPDWLDSIGQLTGTLYVGNQPGTFAIGRLADQRSWLTLSFQWEVWLITHFAVGLCIEYVDGGPRGFAFFIRADGGIDAGIVQVKYYAGLGLSLSFLDTASNDYAIVVYIEAGLKIVLFGFLNFGLSGKATYRNVGTRPSHSELQLQVKLETPWFLPDVTWTLEVTSGSLAPSDLATSTSPLTAVGASDGSSQKSSALHTERFETSHPNTRSSRTYSVNELKAGPPSEAARLASFAADMASAPIAIDATLTIDFAVAVNDKLSLSNDVAPHLGDKQSGDLSLIYDLVEIAVRRRARFGSDRTWYALTSAVALPPDFSDPNGVKLTGTLSPETIKVWWSLDERIEGQPATKKLLFNSETPFQFATANPAADEELIRNQPEWPCCHSRKHPIPIHRLDWFGTPLGLGLSSPFPFSESISQWTFVAPAYAVTDLLSSSFPPAGPIGLVMLTTSGVIARMAFDEDVAYCAVRLAWPSMAGRLAFVAYDSAGTIVGTKMVPTMPASDFQSILIGGSGPIRRIELRGLFPSNFGYSLSEKFVGPSQGRPALEIESAVYVGLEDYLDFARNKQSCDDHSDGFTNGYEGKGKLFFLPNHEYEVKLTTRVTVAHPTMTPDSADVPEYLYFKTKGLPGLNAVQRVGQEIEAYVQSTYGGGRGLLYRREPAVLCFKEDFFVAVPLALRPAGTADEQTTLLRMQLLARPDVAAVSGTPMTTTSEDWIVANHRVTAQPRKYAWEVRKSTGVTFGTPITSTNPMRQRLARLTQRSDAACPLANPLDVVGTALIAYPQGQTDPDDPTRELWTAGAAYTASVRIEDSPFVQRLTLDSADLTSFDHSVDNGPGDANAWDVDSGAVTVETGTVRRFALFGDPDWNHVSISVSVDLGGSAGGVAIALPVGNTPSQGLFALIEATASGRRLALYSRSSGIEMTELAHAALPAADPNVPIALQVMAFDDRIRATVGEVSIEADRGEQREGRVALVAIGAASFKNLNVAGLELYAFPFATSRWRSFREHVLSWPGTFDALAPNALGPGTTTSTVVALWTATQGDATAAMLPNAPTGARDGVFSRWIHDLGIPLKDEVSRVELSAFSVAGQTTCVLLESPEPIDFTSEVTVTLEHRVFTHGGGLGGIVVAEREELQPSLHPAPVDVRAELERAEKVAAIAFSGREPSLPEPTSPNVRVTDISRHERGIDVEFAIERIRAKSLSKAHIVFVERADDPSGEKFRVYTGRIERSARGARVHALESDRVTVLRPQESMLADVLRKIPKGGLVAVVSGIAELGGGIVVGGSWHYEDVPVRIIQDGSARHALLLPMAAGGTPAELSPGSYRLTLAIDRARWATTAAADDVNRYRDSATVTFEL